MERKAYVVTVGEYFDYGIEAVFLDEAAAKEYADKYNKVSGGGYSDEAKVEEHPVDGPIPRVVPILRCHGQVGSAGPLAEYQEEEEGFAWESEVCPVKANSHSALGITRIWVKGTDFERVRKAFRDRWAKAKAEGL